MALKRFMVASPQPLPKPAGGPSDRGQEGDATGVLCLGCGEERQSSMSPARTTGLE
jgi:hypothetical protein